MFRCVVFSEIRDDLLLGSPWFGEIPDESNLQVQRVVLLSVKKRGEGVLNKSEN